MIKSFRNSDTEAVFAGQCPARWKNIRAVAERKLMLVHAAATLGFLRVPPGNRLEKLTGDRAGHWSIRVNDPWRVCCRYEGGDAYDVEIVDYH